jgi:hypothetical protein
LETNLSKNKEKPFLGCNPRAIYIIGVLPTVTMGEIAEDIDIAKASIYFYFPTKEAIIRSVILHEQEEFLTQMNETMLLILNRKLI